MITYARLRRLPRPRAFKAQCFRCTNGDPSQCASPSCPIAYWNKKIQFPSHLWWCFPREFWDGTRVSIDEAVAAPDSVGDVPHFGRARAMKVFCLYECSSEDTRGIDCGCVACSFYAWNRLARRKPDLWWLAPVREWRRYLGLPTTSEEPVEDVTRLFIRRD